MSVQQENTTLGRQNAPQGAENCLGLRCPGGGQDQEMKKKKELRPSSYSNTQDRHNLYIIVRGVSCVLLGFTEAALMGSFTPISRRPAKCAMTFPWIHSGARSAPLCTQTVLMAHFTGRREIGVKFPMKAASVDPKSSRVCPDFSDFGGR